MLTKSLLRKMALKYRRLLSKEVYDQRNRLLIIRLEHFLSQKNFHSVHVFLPIVKNKEPDLQPAFRDWWSRGIKIIGSRTNFLNHTMEHFYLESETRLSPNSMGIPEPINAKTANIVSADVILVPLLLADKRGNRIGYGGGYYDQLLARSTALKIGLSLSPPVDSIVQVEEWDHKMDVIITPFETFEI